MNDLNDKYTELFNELIKNFTFYIPFQVIDDEATEEIFNLLNIDLTQEFVDTYVDKLLYIDENLTIKEVDSFEKLRNSNYTKIHKLESNCFKLIHLKETIGKVSYNFLFKKYMEQVAIYNGISDKLIHYYYIYYPNNAVDPTPCFIQQKNILEKHLSDIEHKINTKGKKITNLEIISNLYKVNIFKPHIKEKNVIIAPDFSTELKSIKKFKDFIKHDNKEEIENIVKTHFSDLKGVSLRYLIEFLKEQGLIILSHGDYTKLHQSLTSLFDGKNIGAYTSIFDKKVFTIGDEKYINAKVSYTKIFSKFLK